MARDNQTNTLELHIKVNGQNLSAISEKYNIGTLRIPSDPSWPKIPPRYSSTIIDDIIEPPCVITLTGTPRKGRSVVQTVASRHLKSRLNQGCEAITQIPKRIPGCFDPRFRRQISRQKAEKPDEFYITKNDEQTPQLDTSITQKTEKLENKSRETSESINDYVPACHDVDHLLNVTKSANKMTDYSIGEQSILEAKHCPTLQYATNEQYDVGNGFPQEQNQETNRPLFLMVNEKRIHALPINPVNIETASSSAQPLQCYSVQIPIVAYRDTPLQISSMLTQMGKDVNMPSVCQNDSVKDRETVGNVCTESLKSINSVHSFRESKNEKYPLDNNAVFNIERHNAKSNDDISKNKSISNNCEGYHTFEREIDAKESVASLNQDITKNITLDNDRCGNFDELELNNAVDVNNDKSLSYSNLNVAARLKNFVDQSYVMDSCIANGEKNEREMSKSSERKMAKARTCSCIDTGMQKLAYHVKDDRGNAVKSWTNVINDKVLDKNLVFSQVDEKEEYSKNNKKQESKEEKHGEGELRINVKRKTPLMNLSKKAKSFLRKKSRFAITDSDYTLILPGYRGIKGKRYKKSRGRSKISHSLHGRNGINSTNSILVKYNASKQDRINSRSLMNLQTRNSFEKPSSIPLETQELLNKSYWEYYWKLRRKIKPDNAKEKDKCLNEHLPESQTLRQCSVLSCMINTALRNSTRTTGDERASSNPNMTFVAQESVSALPSMLVKKIQRKRMKRTSKRLLGLRAIALLCIAMYVAVILLPMMYDYIFDEEYDDENTNYIELIFQYITSSFGEALDGIIDVLTTIFLRPVRFDRKR
ncbi:PREDICTED: uncharacterized protein LOC108757310 isoform X2 [Trachymyrmex septentrionalis]|uniref:uncharacterized protein LOC108757310 isoform X2 n=1 Tax=Trachymyrmex septentrionalis TaxID=34720 RepID=UPI00084F3777|nr:PREDICTED: uncharacterized protein LOC108757310 isoform X2 [Trachymyrmex septentrionalis]